MSFIDSVKSGFVRYFEFENRSSRSEYWWWMLFVWLTSLLLTVINSALFGPTVVESNTGELLIMYDAGVPGLVFSLFVLIPSLALNCRRLHDIDKSGWWQTILLIPIVGLIVMVYWCVKAGDRGENRFGPDPLRDNNEGFHHTPAVQ